MFSEYAKILMNGSISICRLQVLDIVRIQNRMRSRRQSKLNLTIPMMPKHNCFWARKRRSRHWRSYKYQRIEND